MSEQDEAVFMREVDARHAVGVLKALNRLVFLKMQRNVVQKLTL